MSGTTHGLVVGDLDLASPFEHESGCMFSVVADGASFGNPEAVVRSLVSMLADGDQVRYDRAGNRVVSFTVQLDAPDGVALAAGEVALRRELYRRNTVTWTPPADFGPATVYEVVTSSMSASFDDLDEINTRRRFAVSLTCAPFARSQSLTMVAALDPPPVTPTTATVTNADTTTGFSASKTVISPFTGTVTTPLSVTDQGAYVQATATENYFSVTIAYSTAGVSMASTRYLVVEMSGDAPYQFELTINGVQAIYTPVVSRALTGGLTQYVFDTGGGTFTGFNTGLLKGPIYGGTATITLNVHDISRTDTLPQVSARQVTRVIEVGGTERTPGSLKVSAPDGSSALQLAIVATWPEEDSGFSPPLRRWRVTGNTPTADANTYSGAREPIGPSFVQFDIPITSLPPRTYQLMALMRATSIGTYPLEAGIQSRLNGVTLGETWWGAGGTEPFTFNAANDWTLVPMGVYRVPIVAAKAGEFRVQIKAQGTTNVQFDEAWLFPVDDDCALSAVLTTKPHLWFDSPGLDSSVPKLWQGSAADKSDAHWPTAVATMGQHVFVPGRTAVFTATFEVDYPRVTLTYHKRWHSNAGED